MIVQWQGWFRSGSESESETVRVRLCQWLTKWLSRQWVTRSLTVSESNSGLFIQNLRTTTSTTSTSSSTTLYSTSQCKYYIYKCYLGRKCKVSNLSWRHIKICLEIHSRLCIESAVWVTASPGERYASNYPTMTIVLGHCFDRHLRQRVLNKLLD